MTQSYLTVLENDPNFADFNYVKSFYIGKGC